MDKATITTAISTIAKEFDEVPEIQLCMILYTSMLMRSLYYMN